MRTKQAAWNKPGTLTRTEAFIPPIPPVTTKIRTALDSGALAGLRDQGRAIAMQSRHVAWLGFDLTPKASYKPSHNHSANMMQKSSSEDLPGSIAMQSRLDAWSGSL